MKTMFAKISAIVVAATLGLSVAATGAFAASEYPLNKPREQDWSFAGPFGTYDKGQLQRGFKVYREVCAACHSMNRVAFRSLEDLGYSEGQIKAIAAEYDITDGPNADGEMFTRPGTGADHFTGPYPNREASVAANGGAYPPDFSLLAKARAVERGFPTFVFDVFTQYAENGPDYIYSLLTGYPEDGEAPEGAHVAEGTHYNPYYIGGASLAMAAPLSEDIVSFDDGTPATVDQMAKDVSAFMMWAAEPKLEERKSLGFKVIIFLLIFAVFLYLTKKQIYAKLEH